MLPGNGIDASDRDDAVNIANWPLLGMYQPDTIAALTVNGTTYLITANEGDARDYDGFSEEDRIKGLTLDPTAFPNAADLQMDERIGRLETTTAFGDDDNDGDYDRLFAYGARSFSVWSTGGTLLYDSGDTIEQTVAAAGAADFNANNDENGSFDSRSDAKGPEPEGLATGYVAGEPYGFIGLERQGGFLVYNMSDPANPDFFEYRNNRDFSGDAEAGTAGDLGPEGLTFIPASESPTYQPLLAVMNEVSATTTLYELEDDCAEPTITSVAPVGQPGIIIRGTPDCVYRVSVTDANGVVTVIPVAINTNGSGSAEIVLGPDNLIEVSQINAGTASASANTVPTLQTWGFLTLVTVLLVAAIVSMRRRKKV